MYRSSDQGLCLVVYHQASKGCSVKRLQGKALGPKIRTSEAWWYTTPLASQLIRQQVGGFSSMWDSQNLAKMHAEDVASMPRTLKAWWYTTPLASQLIRQQVGRVFLRYGTPRTLQKCMPRTPKTLQSMPRTLSSMPRSCQASLHILGSHRNFKKKKKNHFSLF